MEMYNYKEVVKKYGSFHKLEKAIQNKEIYKIEKGIYSDDPCTSIGDIINKKYPDAIYTNESAYYFLGLTDHIPEYEYLATDRNSRKIRDKRIKQLFIPANMMEFGVEEFEYNMIKGKRFDLERMLCELAKHSKTMPFDYYKEICLNYREKEIDFHKLDEYLTHYKNKSKLLDIIQREVF